MLELLGDRPGVRHRAGEAVEFWDHERVAVADGGERLGEPGSVAVAAGEPAVEIDPVVLDAELGERLALGCEVLGGGRASCVSNERSRTAAARAFVVAAFDRFEEGLSTP